jgi:hypothetical protein
MPLGLAVEMSDDPAPGPLAGASRDQIGVLPGRLAQRYPAQSNTRGDNTQNAEPAGPGCQRCPRGNRRGAEQRKQNQRKQAEAVPEDGKRLEAGGSEVELLELDGIAEAFQVGDDDLTGGSGLGGAGLARNGEELPGNLVQGGRKRRWFQDACLGARRALRS